jgi:acid stress-induced BolA-like protein IbaG/YrbA
MSLKIVSNAVDLSGELRSAISAVLPEAEVEVRLASPGPYEIDVCAEAFQGKTLVQQQQVVYGAIMRFMAGDDAPVHAIDRMRTRTP